MIPVSKKQNNETKVKVNKKNKILLAKKIHKMMNENLP